MMNESANRGRQTVTVGHAVTYLCSHFIFGFCEATKPQHGKVLTAMLKCTNQSGVCVCVCSVAITAYESATGSYTNPPRKRHMPADIKENRWQK